MSEGQNVNALAALTPDSIDRAIQSDRGLMDYLDKAPGYLQISRQTYQTINSDEEADGASELLNWFKDGRKKVMDVCKPLTDLLNSLHKTATGKRGEMCRTFDDGIQFLDGAIRDYIRRGEEEKRRLQAEQEAALRKEQERLKREAEAQVERGNVKQAEQIEQMAQTMVAPSLPPARPSLSGTNYRGKYVAKVSDIRAFAKAILDGKIPLEHMYRGERRCILMVDNSILQQEANRMGEALQWPGITVEEDYSLSKKGGKR